MAANHVERTRSTGRRSTALVVCASVGTIVAAATSHLSPSPAMSATVVLATAALVVLLASPGAGITTGLGLAATAAAATAFLGGRPPDVLGAAAQIALTTVLTAFVIRHVRAPAGRRHPPSRDDRRPVEPALLDLARATLGQVDVTAVESAMEALLEALDCDALSVWRNVDDPGSSAAEIRYRAGRRPDEPAVIHWSRAPSAASRFSTGRSHTFVDVNDLPNPDRAGYRRVGFSAAIEYPVTVHGAWVGHVSMACSTGTRTWEQHELDVVSTVADLVTSIWERETTVECMEQVVAQRDRSLVIQQAIGESARLIFESDDGDLSATSFAPRWQW